MVDVGAAQQMLLESMADAFARGDGVGAELLLMAALDHGVPWDEVTATAARGVARRYQPEPVAVGSAGQTEARVSYSHG